MEEAKNLLKVYIKGHDYESTGWYCSDRSILILAGSTVSPTTKPILTSGGLKERL